jgi:hypothetical protein
MVPFYQYIFILQGAKNFDFQESIKGPVNRRRYSIEYGEMFNKYVMVDVPSFKDERFISNMEDYLIKIDFQLVKIIHVDGTASEITTTWPNLIKNLSKNASFGKFVKNSSSESKKIVAELNIADKSEEEKIQVITDYVKKHYSWNGNYGKYSSTDPKNFIKEKSGNIAELNLLLVSILNTAGIEAWPVILSTRNIYCLMMNYL